MCQNSISGVQSEQIRKFVENGMPKRIIKTVQYTLRKRAAAEQKAAAEAKNSMETFGHYSETRNASDDNMTTMNNNNNNNTTTHTANITNVTVTTSSSTTTDIGAINQSFTKMGETLNIPRLCGRFRKLQQQQTTTMENSKLVAVDDITNISAASNIDGLAVGGRRPRNAGGEMDALAIATQFTKDLVHRAYGMAVKLQSSKLYKLLTRTTQPAHLIAVAVLTFVLFTVWPDIVDTRTTTTTTVVDDSGAITAQQRPHNTLAAIAYLGAFAMHFGAQIWMTFVSGLSLYFSLPRHTFGQCQQILFPRYFAMSSLLSISMLILFVKYFLSTWNLAAMVQLISLGGTALIEVIIRLYLAPPMLALMVEKYRIEGAIGSGQEVGTLDQGDLIQCPHYQRIHKAFRRIHMTIAMGNMTVLLATCLHLYFLASKIQIS